ncbi:MAG: hypothetical protein ED559_10455 [Phycisphaera sp.]|nr:MAG: hypothetical protein ED559_10455 [Phycisphaera sp.]
MIIASLLTAGSLLLQPEEAENPAGRVEVFEGVIVDYDARSVEVAGFMPVDVSHEETPDVWIELIAEAHGVRDFEALISLDTEARNVHAALLMLGLEPGSPGRIDVDHSKEDSPLTRVDPTGPELSVRIRYEKDGTMVTEDPTTWVHDPETGQVFSELNPRFYFGGSSFRTFEGEEWYMARVEGTVVGLCTFGTIDGGAEIVGCTPVLSPHMDMGDPVWYTINELVPAYGTEMTLVLTVVKEDSGEGVDVSEKREE